MSANEQMAAAKGLGFVPYTRPTGTDTAEPLKIGVLISGSGTNLQALIDLIAAGKLNASIELVVSSRPSAKGLQRAERAGIQTLTLSKDVYADPIAADEIIAHELLERGYEYVVMAGYMRMVHTPLLAAFPNRVVNLHPALLPSFTGAHAIDDAFARGVKVTGVTVHFANEIYDNGPIIAQRALAVAAVRPAGCSVSAERLHVRNHWVKEAKMKIRALITLVIGKNKEILPGNICDVSETEANRLISLGFAEKLTKGSANSSSDSGKKQAENKENDGKPDENGNGQSV